MFDCDVFFFTLLTLFQIVDFVQKLRSSFNPSIDHTFHLSIWYFGKLIFLCSQKYFEYLEKLPNILINMHGLIRRQQDFHVQSKLAIYS